MRPPCSYTPRSHSIQTASINGQVHACVWRHFLPWQTHASQKSQIAPTYGNWNFKYFIWFHLLVANTNHSKSSGKHSRMLDHTIACLLHAFRFAALCTNWKTLNALAEIAKCSRFLLTLALIALKFNEQMKISTYYMLLLMHLLMSFWLPTSIDALHGTSASDTVLVRISFCRIFCFSAFLRWPVFFLGILR